MAEVVTAAGEFKLAEVATPAVEKRLAAGIRRSKGFALVRVEEATEVQATCCC